MRKLDVFPIAGGAVFGWAASEALGPGTLLSWLLLAVVTVTATVVWVICRRR